MNNNDFRYMRRGKQLAELTTQDSALLQPINIRGTGKERALLVLHGFSSSPAVYRYLLPKITGYDAIVCPALPGHGESIAAFSQTKASDWLDASADVCGKLVQEYPIVDVLGLSLGGLLACELSKHFTLNHLFLLAPALKLHMNIGLTLKLAHFLNYWGFQQLRNAAGSMCTNERAEIAYRKLPIPTIIEILQLIQHYQWQAPTCSVDLFLGSHDPVVASHKVDQLFAPLENTRIHWLTNSAHVLALDNDFETIVDCINTQSRIKQVLAS